MGNPPFSGKNTVAAANVPSYPLWLKELHAESHGNADLVAHFFRRSFDLLRSGGTFGLIATNTIRQGDTRSTGLRWICKNGGKIFRALTRYKWLGQAAVVVSIVHVAKGAVPSRRLLDGRTVDEITAFLFHTGGHQDPARLEANANQSFQGSIVLGMGFTFDDTDTKGVATPLAEMRRLLRENPRNSEVIFPYIGGQEVNTSPIHAHHRYVINFWDCPLRREDLGSSWLAADGDRRTEWRREGIVPVDYPGPVAVDWQELLAIVEERVKPDRDRQNRRARRERWWQHAENQPGLYAAIASLDHVLVTGAAATKYHVFARISAKQVFSHKLIVFPLSSHTAFACLQARPHEVWRAAFGSTLEDRLTYTPSDVFETFPFPQDWNTDFALKDAGRAYYDFRADLMVGNGEGLTKTYNRFHDPTERDPTIKRLRDLHAVMDRAALAAYGWEDIPTECEFVPEHEGGGGDGDDLSRRTRRYRYRWPNRVRDEVLARLLKLNAVRSHKQTG